jgi:uncharacterized protein involved in type VI secretion and phage assembly
MMDDRTARYIERNEGKYWGKCRGIVADRNDPDQLGRLKLTVPSLFGDEKTGWAAPASPFAGADIGFFFLPQVGDMVWVEFEEGDLDQPIWSGGSWARPDRDSEIPAEAKTSYPEQAVIKTKAGNVIVLVDAAGKEGIVIRTPGGCEIVMDPNTNLVTVQAGEIHLRGSSGEVQELATRAFVEEVFDTHTHSTGVGPSGPPSNFGPSSRLSAQVGGSLTGVVKAE